MKLGPVIYKILVILFGVTASYSVYYIYGDMSKDDFEGETIIGSLYLGNVDPSQYDNELEKSFQSWYDNVEYIITYQGYEYSVDLRQTAEQTDTEDEIIGINYDLSGSVSNIVEGKTKPIIFTLSDDYKEEVIDGLTTTYNNQVLIDNIDMEALFNKINASIEFMDLYEKIKLEDYLSSEEALLVDVNTFEMLNVPDVDGIIATLTETNLLTLTEESVLESSIVLSPEDVFSFNETFTSEDFTSVQRNVLASGITRLMWETNLDIIEIQSAFELRDYTDYGYNTYVSEFSDFKIFNPNGYGFNIVVEKNVNNNLLLRLVGHSYVDDYSHEIVKHDVVRKSVQEESLQTYPFARGWYYVSGDITYNSITMSYYFDVSGNANIVYEVPETIDETTYPTPTTTYTDVTSGTASIAGAVVKMYYHETHGWVADANATEAGTLTVMDPSATAVKPAADTVYYFVSGNITYDSVNMNYYFDLTTGATVVEEIEGDSNPTPTTTYADVITGNASIADAIVKMYYHVDYGWVADENAIEAGILSVVNLSAGLVTPDGRCEIDVTGTSKTCTLPGEDGIYIILNNIVNYKNKDKLLEEFYVPVNDRYYTFEIELEEE